MDPSRYFDNAATTRVDPVVLREMEPYWGEAFGNASSIHQFGQRAGAAVELARSRVAALLGCEPEQIFFTSGATESNNWVLRSFSRVEVSPFEHSSVWDTARVLGHGVLGNKGYSLDPPHPDAELVSVMLVNNETGAVIQPPDSQALLYRDITQALGKCETSLDGVAFASFSSHKIHGPKGVGGLYVADPTSLAPLLFGGGQEQGLRAGTLNVPGIVGLGAACALAAERREDARKHVESLRETVLETLSKVPDWRTNDGIANSQFILSVSMLGLQGETLALACDEAGFAVSSGAACSSSSTEPSHVLTALGVPDEYLRGTIRVSFSTENTESSSKELATTLADATKRLRRLAR